MKDLTPDQHDAVRRALADARHTDPIPADVADRLDRVLDDLADERSAATESAHSVVSLEARRRRRHATRMLVAAAAVVVGGFSINAIVGHDLITGRSADEGAMPTAVRDDNRNLGSGAGTGAQAPGSGSENGPLDGIGSPAVPEPSEDAAYGWMAATIRPDYLREDAMKAAQLNETASMKLACVAHTKDERVIPVRYVNRRAALVVRVPEGGYQRLDLYYCPMGHAGRLIRSVVVPAR